jgi:hypothetical protein
MNHKEVVYVDVEDEITQIIEKVTSSKSKIIALVLPKRATVFQSIVNMKLLKRKTDQADKKVVLVTSEPGLMPLAGAVGVHVAKSLQDQPEIPPNPVNEDSEPVNLEDDSNVKDKKLDNTKPIGELAGLAAVGAMVSKSKGEEDTIEFDNDAIDELGLDDIDKESDKKTKKTKKVKGLNGKSTKIPDFNRFRTGLLIGLGVIILLVVLYIIGFKVLPKATIVVETNTSSINSSLSLTLSQANTSLNPANDTVPAKFQTITKTATSTSVNTTGTKTIGTPATGTINVSFPSSACNFGCNADSIPAGTVFTDPSGNFNFTSTTATTVPACPHHCSSTTIPVSVAADDVGASYDLQAAPNYTSSGTTANGNPLSNFKMGGSAMTGGSSSIVQVVAQADITSAQSQLTAPDSSQLEQQLESNLRSEGYVPVTVTYVAGNPTYTPSAAVGVQANSITVSESIVYSMYGVMQSDVQTLINNNINLQINTATQSVLDSGAENADYTLQSTGSGSDQVTMQSTSTIGPKLNAATIASQSAGQRSGDIKNSISQIPGVTNVIVKYSPFWVSSTPKSVKKITVVIEKANGSQL